MWIEVIPIETEMRWAEEVFMKKKKLFGKGSTYKFNRFFHDKYIKDKYHGITYGSKMKDLEDAIDFVIDRKNENVYKGIHLHDE